MEMSDQEGEKERRELKLDEKSCGRRIKMKQDIYICMLTVVQVYALLSLLLMLEM